MTTTTYLGSGDASRHRRDYRPEWLDNLADDVTIEGSVLTGIVEGPEAIRAILGFARQLYDYQEFNYVGRYRPALCRRDRGAEDQDRDRWARQRKRSAATGREQQRDIGLHG